jgi:hypothetical protein
MTRWNSAVNLTTKTVAVKLKDVMIMLILVILKMMIYRIKTLKKS